MNRIWKLTDRNLLVTKLRGTASLDTVREFRRIIVNLPGFSPDQDHLIDLADVREVTITPQQFRNIGENSVHSS